MGLFDAILGRRKPVGPNLDALFALPSAAITLQVSLDQLPTGRGAVASFTAILAGFMMRSAMWGTMGRNRDNNVAIMVFAVTIVSVIVYFLSFILMRALSRYRELGADRGAALLTGKPSALARALQKISGEMATIPTRDLRQMEPVSAFAFAPAIGGRKGIDLATIFATHPSLEKRLEQLARIQAQLGER